MKRNKPKYYSRMRPTELDALATKFDREIDFAETKPLTPSMRKQEQRARRKKPGRSQAGFAVKHSQSTSPPKTPTPPQ